MALSDNFRDRLYLTAPIVEPDFIDQTLDFYLPDMRCVEEVHVNENGIEATIRLIKYPFVKDNALSYVTGPMFFLYLSQAGYLLIRLLANGQIAKFGIEMSDSDFFDSRDSGNIVFTKVNKLRFQRKIFVSESHFKLRLELLRLAQVPGLLIGHTNFRTTDESITGQSHVVIQMS